MKDFINEYEAIRGGGLGIYRQRRTLIKVSGNDAVQFLNGLVTNDVAKLEDGSQMLAAFPTVKGRLFALTRIARRGEKFFIETEQTTGTKVFENLSRFVLAGDFSVIDDSENFGFYSCFGESNLKTSEGLLQFGSDFFVPKALEKDFEASIEGAIAISDVLCEILRIERGIAKYGVDMDEETVVSELGFDEMISYEKGCYIGQEVIARIHFKGKPAKILTGLIFDEEAEVKPGDQILVHDGANAGKITSIAFSPTLKKTIALGYVRNRYLDNGTELTIGKDRATVTEFPFVKG